MSIIVEPELGVPLVSDTPYLDLKARAEYACNTAAKLQEHGLELDPTKEDKDVAAKLTLAYAKDPEKTSKKVTVEVKTPNQNKPKLFESNKPKINVSFKNNKTQKRRPTKKVVKENKSREFSKKDLTTLLNRLRG